MTRQTFLPVGPRWLTSISVPRWACSCSATTPPRKVSQTNSQREISSEIEMPELKP